VCLQGGDAAGAVALEAGIGAEVAAELGRRGHRVSIIDGMQRALFGRGQIIITCDPDTGVLCAGSDPRADGCALGR
jgi:gamma-glutamyltranspeptidase/glutathione hydrolase